MENKKNQIDSTTLTKTTHYPKSLSLTDAEFKALCEGVHDRISVYSFMGNKRIVVLEGARLQKSLEKARLNLVKDNPDGAHYWVLRW
jgi:hypothetical protein